MAGLPEYFSDLRLVSGVGPMLRPDIYEKGGRIKLDVDTTYYVEKTGSDLADGLTSGTAFATVTRALEQLDAVDAGNNIITLAIGAGTWNESVTVVHPILAGRLVIRGVVGTILDGGNSLNDGILIHGPVPITFIEGTITVQNFINSHCKIALGILHIKGTLISKAGVTNHIVAGYHGNLHVYGSIKITNSSCYAIISSEASNIYFQPGSSLVYEGNPTFSQANFLAQYKSVINAVYNTFSGTAIGLRYRAFAGSVIWTAGRGVNSIPGTSAGYVDNDGSFYN
jgi:hypothetical protein